MIRMTRLPEEVARLLSPLKPYFSYRHYVVFCWLLVAHLVCLGKATARGWARYTPAHVAAWPLRRVLAAGRWQWEQGLHWLVRGHAVRRLGWYRADARACRRSA